MVRRTASGNPGGLASHSAVPRRRLLNSKVGKDISVNHCAFNFT